MPGIICAVSWDKPLDEPWLAALGRAVDGLRPPGPSIVSRFATDRVFIGVCGHDEANRVDAVDGAAAAVMGDVAEPDLQSGPCGLGVPMALARLAAAGDFERLEGLNGLSAVVAWDEKGRTLHAITDRLGAVNLFAWETDGRVVLSTHMLSLAGLPGFKRDLDRQGVADILAIGCCIDGRTLYKNVRRIERSRHTRWSAEASSERLYWPIRFAQPDGERPMDDYGDELAGIIRSAVKRRRGMPLLHTLSAGFDSRILAAAAAEELGAAAQTAFTLGPSDSYDGRFGAQVAALLGIPHRRIDIPADFFAAYAREGLWRSDGMIIGHTCWRLAADGHLGGRPGGLVVNGNGGDHFHGSSYIGLMDGQPDAASAFDAYFNASVFWKVIEAADLRVLMRPELHRETEGVAAGRLKSIFVDAPAEHNRNRLDHVLLETISPRRYQRMNYDFLAGVSRVCQPFRDNAVTEFLLRTPPVCRQDSAMYKSMLIRHWPRAARAVYAGTGLPLKTNAFVRLRYKSEGWLLYKALPALTAGAWRRPNPGTYVHYLEWLRGANRRFVESLLIEEDHLGDLLDAGAVAAATRDVLQGRSGDYGKVYTLASLALFRREFG